MMKIKADFVNGGSGEFIAEDMIECVRRAMRYGDHYHTRISCIHVLRDWIKQCGNVLEEIKIR